MCDDTLDIDVAITARTPQFDENEAARAGWVSMRSGGTGDEDIRRRVKLDADHALLALNEEPCVWFQDLRAGRAAGSRCGCCRRGIPWARLSTP